MSILDWFDKKEKKTVNSEKLNIPGNLWIKCVGCNEIIFKKDFQVLLFLMHIIYDLLTFQFYILKNMHLNL